MIWTCPNLECPWGIGYSESGKKGENCPTCGTKLENFGTFGANSYGNLRKKKQEMGKKGAHAKFESRKNIAALHIVNGRIKPSDVQDRYVIITDTSRGTFNNLQEAINIFAREGWRVVSFQISEGTVTGSKVATLAYVIMEHETS